MVPVVVIIPRMNIYYRRRSRNNHNSWNRFLNPYRGHTTTGRKQHETQQNSRDKSFHKFLERLPRIRTGTFCLDDKRATIFHHQSRKNESIGLCRRKEVILLTTVNQSSIDSNWLRGLDSNQRPFGYGPNELTRLLHPAIPQILQRKSFSRTSGDTMTAHSLKRVGDLCVNNFSCQLLSPL